MWSCDYNTVARAPGTHHTLLYSKRVKPYTPTGWGRGGTDYRRASLSVPRYLSMNHTSYTVIFGLQIRALLGGKMEFIIVGGAPLSRETHEFIRVCLGAIVVPVIHL